MIQQHFGRTAFGHAAMGGLSLAIALGGMGFSAEASADREVRGGARTSVNQNANANRNVNANVNRNVNANSNVNVNRNVNVNNNVNVNRNVHVSNGGGYNRSPVATAVAVGATVAVTSAVIGSMVRTLPPACTATVVNGVTYHNCGGAWYQPQYSGTQITYVVVNAPG